MFSSGGVPLVSAIKFYASARVAQNRSISHLSRLSRSGRNANVSPSPTPADEASLPNRSPGSPPPPQRRCRSAETPVLAIRETDRKGNPRQNHHRPPQRTLLEVETDAYRKTAQLYGLPLPWDPVSALQVSLRCRISFAL